MIGPNQSKAVLEFLEVICICEKKENREQNCPRWYLENTKSWDGTGTPRWFFLSLTESKSGKESHWEIYHGQVKVFIDICDGADVLGLNTFF